MIIGLHGLPHTGKDTIADYLYHQHGFGRIAFAGPVKDMLVTFGVQRELLNDPAKKEQVIEWIGQSPRQLMRSLGTDWGRSLVADNIWIRHAARRLQLQRRIGPKVVFTDVRFPNEAEFVRAHGGVIWHVERPGQAERSGHSSDQQLPFLEGDRLVRNDGTVVQLHCAVEFYLATRH